MKEGAQIGRVNGLAVMGEDSGIVLPIIAEVTPTQSMSEGHIIATGMLKNIAKGYRTPQKRHCTGFWKSNSLVGK